MEITKPPYIFFAEAAEEAPTTEILNDLGYAQQTCGHIQEAERSFREALTIAPDNTQAAINLGALLFNKGKIEAAAYWLERGIASIDSARRTAVRQIIADSESQPEPGGRRKPSSSGPVTLATSNSSGFDSGVTNHSLRAARDIYFLARLGKQHPSVTISRRCLPPSTCCSARASSLALRSQRFRFCSSF